MKKTIKITKTYTVKVSRYIEADIDDLEYIDCECDNLEHDANLDLANIGQENAYESEYYCTDMDVDVVDVKYVVRHDFGLFGESYDVGEYTSEADAMKHFVYLSSNLGPNERCQVRMYDDVGEHLIADMNNFVC